MTGLWERAKTPLAVLGGFIFLLWFLEFVDWLVFNGALDGYGIKPRTTNGLLGIFYAPFLHGGFGHLMANTMPILILGGLILISRGLRDFFIVTGLVMIVSGLGTWLIGPSFSVHIGASGLVFGYFGFLLLMAYFERSCRAIVVAGVVFFVYGGLIWGILPHGDGISWQSHLFGLVGGFLAAYLMGKNQLDPSVTPTGEPPMEDNIVIHDSYDI
ncbi:MAG: rhomboid family intramembrane serine protease [Chloroflexi bacterium]|nr:rhomboid family intramembrane serine protease [Ardenticatenaceae bacterium]MBL1128399.1 rhomboid family intramembrane serine protease [Chloroflexota bacterium]NOG34476.1 rhomboid family intramembrane serine protease [Chloroflexota bacterium]